jgi:NAD(P)-dependent dehydrogenase (short-subunit alcohol dehydrogenase family)
MSTKKVGLVTGGSRGLGEVIAAVLAAQGYNLVVGGRDLSALDGVRHRLAAAGARVITVAGDITEPSTRTAYIEAARELGGLDVLVNNASELGPIGPLLDFDVPRLGRLFPVNAAAPLWLIQLAAPLLAERRGLVVNITSDAAVAGYPGWGPYGASKAALELISRTLASELADRGIAVVLVDPGDMRTRMHQEAFAGQDISDRPLPEVTAPFWNWLFGQPHSELSGQRLLAQQEDARWLQSA